VRSPTPQQGPNCQSACARRRGRARAAREQHRVADALRATGRTVHMETLPGAGPSDLYDAQIASLIVEWIDSLGSPPSMS
jgi:hypothetical protein